MKNLVIILLFIFASCSTKKDTEANFQVSLRNMVGNNNDASLFPGGLILYGVSGQLSFSRIMDSTIKDELVPNGIWDFYVLGWDGKAPDRKPMTGKVYCGVAKGVNLNGTATKVELTATNAKCADSIFGNHVTEKSLTTIQPQMLQKIMIGKSFFNHKEALIVLVVTFHVPRLSN